MRRHPRTWLCCWLVGCAFVTLNLSGCDQKATPTKNENKDQVDPKKGSEVANEKPPAFDGPKSGKIKIVSSMPRTGSAKGQTDTIANGIKLALEEVNYKVGDFTIEYEDLDDATATNG